MKKIKYFTVLCCINFSFASSDGGFFEQWFLPDKALFIWSVITFLIVLGILRWKAWGPLMDTLDARAKQIEESLSKAEIVATEAKEQAQENPCSDHDECAPSVGSIDPAGLQLVEIMNCNQQTKIVLGRFEPPRRERSVFYFSPTAWKFHHTPDSVQRVCTKCVFSSSRRVT